MTSSQVRWLGVLAAVMAGSMLIVACGSDSGSGSGACGSGAPGIGDIAGGICFSTASGVSSNGLVAVGQGNSAKGQEAFLWTSGGGAAVGLGDLPGGAFISQANGISADGLVVVGNGRSALSFEAFRWTAGGGMVGLGDLPGGDIFSDARAVSADGSVVVGRSDVAAGGEAFRWTVPDGMGGGGMVGLGDLAGGAHESQANAASADGSAVVGFGGSLAGVAERREAFRWDSAGMLGLGDLNTGTKDRDSEARGISADGFWVVGASSSPSGLEAFIWITPFFAFGGMSGLGDLPGGVFGSVATAVSSVVFDVVVVGYGHSASGKEAFILVDDGMTLTGVMQELDVFVSSRGFDLSGWTETEATGISGPRNATVVVGNGINPDGDHEGWVVGPFNVD